MDTPLDFATRLAKETGQFLAGQFKVTGTAGTLKADHSIVTEADLAADRLIAAAIHAGYPGEGLISEEIAPVYAEEVRATWIVDPLDGTTNFSLGMLYWGVSIGRLIDGQPDTAAVYFPLLDELYTAQKGAGAFFNGQRLQLDEAFTRRTDTFFACCSRTFRRYNVSLPYKARILGSAAYNFCALSRGIAMIAFEARAKVWDIAAVWLIVQEAGGIIESFDGDSPFPLRTGTDYRMRNLPTLGAISEEFAAQGKSGIVRKEGDLVRNDRDHT